MAALWPAVEDGDCGSMSVVVYDALRDRCLRSKIETLKAKEQLRLGGYRKRTRA